jgi:hypothetical protein
MPEITGLMNCNCSICTKKGYIWAFPHADNLKIVKGEAETLKDYAFAGKKLIHMFCPTCGIAVAARQKDTPAEKPNALNVSPKSQRIITTTDHVMIATHSTKPARLSEPTLPDVSAHTCAGFDLASSTDISVKL